MPEPQGEPVGFGAIRIELDSFTDEAQEQIVGCHVPLGTILREYSVQHSSHPSAYFAVEPDHVIRHALKMSNGSTLFGRHNIISGIHRELLAEVVEILPPMEDRGA
jgi:hypothetical protein